MSMNSMEEEDTRTKSTDELLRYLFNKLELVEADAVIAKEALEARVETVNSSINARMETMISEVRLLFERLKPADEGTNWTSNTSPPAVAYSHNTSPPAVAYSPGNGGTNWTSNTSPPAVAYSNGNGILPTQTQSDMNSNQTETEKSSITESKSMEFPRFNPENPRDWVLETIKYFNNNPMVDSDRIDLAICCVEVQADEDSKYHDLVTCCMEGQAKEDSKYHHGMSWSKFIDSILTMSNDEPGQNDVIVDFHQLRQHGSFDDYLKLWIQLRDITSVVYPDLPESYYIRCFIGGLKNEVRTQLWLIRPPTLELAITWALFYVSELSRSSHLDLEPTEKDCAEISMNTLSGFSSYQSIRLLGKVGEHEMTILVDFCSTHSFIKESTANHLRCSLKETRPPLPVTSPNGSTTYSLYECPEFCWVMKGNEFKTYHVHILDDLNCDLVLGLNWLKEIGPIELDYKTMELTVFLHGKTIVLND